VPCAACHMIGDGAINRIGPHLNGLVGRGIGAVDGYDFSDIFLEAAAQGRSGRKTALDGFIANPDGYLPGTSMVFRGIRAAQDRADLIAFIVQEGGAAEAGEDTGPSPRSRRSSRSRATSPTANTCRRNAPPAISAREAGHSVDPGPDAERLHRGHGGLPLGRTATPGHEHAGRTAGDEEIAALAAYFLSENN
jgi:cytochrome c2